MANLYLLNQEIKRRMAYVDAFITKSCSNTTRDSDSQLVLEVSQRIKDHNPPSRQTVKRWFLTYIQSNGDMSVLNPKHFLKGNRNPKFAGVNSGNKDIKKLEKAKEIDSIVTREITNNYSSPKTTIKFLFNLINLEIEKFNIYQVKEDKLPRIHISSIYRRIQKAKKQSFLFNFFRTFTTNQKYSPYITLNRHLNEKSKIQAEGVVKKIIQIKKLSNSTISHKVKPTKLVSIIRFLRDKFKTEAKSYFYNHQKYIKERRQGIKNRSLYELVIAYNKQNQIN